MRNNVFLALLMCLAGLLGYRLAIAQRSALDPVRVAPHIFEKLLENDRLRVLKVTERSGETQPLHSHPDRLIVYLSPCAWIEATADGGEQMQSFRLGDAIWARKLTHGGKGNNVVQDCSRLEIEIKQ